MRDHGTAVGVEAQILAMGSWSTADDGELRLPDQPEAARADDNDDDQCDQSKRRFLPPRIGHIWIHFGQPLAYRVTPGVL
jgi:hypothetical protein